MIFSIMLNMNNITSVYTHLNQCTRIFIFIFKYSIFGIIYRPFHICKGRPKSVSTGPCFDDDVIYIGLGVAPDLPLEAFLDGLLVCSAHFLDAERHGVVAVRPEGCDEGGLLLIRLLQGDLMVA